MLDYCHRQAVTLRSDALKGDRHAQACLAACLSLVTCLVTGALGDVAACAWSVEALQGLPGSVLDAGGQILLLLASKLETPGACAALLPPVPAAQAGSSAAAGAGRDAGPGMALLTELMHLGSLLAFHVSAAFVFENTHSLHQHASCSPARPSEERQP